MSTSEQLREQPPSPLEIVDDFRTAHQALFRDVLTAHTSPSDKHLLMVAERLVACQEKVEPLEQNLFFKREDNPLYMSNALGALIGASNELRDKVLELTPEFRDVEYFDSHAQIYLAYCLSEDETIELPDEIKSQIEAGKKPYGPEEASKRACSTYRGILKDFEEAFQQSPNVAGFLKHKEEIKARNEKVKIYGGTALAAFGGAIAGTLAANWIQKHR